VEDQVPDVRAARRLGIPILHRSELLARHVSRHRTIAITGTSGKSTVTAMVFTILRGAGREPSLLTGGNLETLSKAGYLGNAWVGTSDLLVIEADESDGSLVRYEPWIGVLLNLRRDHKESAELAEMFAAFRRHTRGPFLCGEEANLHPFAEDATVFGLEPSSEVHGEQIVLTRDGSSFTVAGTQFRLPLPGRHNVSNAVAAIAACRAAQLDVAEMVTPLASFAGVARRFQTIGTVQGIEVIDDFAHNPDKIGAALTTARARLAPAGSGRILAIFQPHGFGPTRFLRDDLCLAFATHLGPDDRLWLPEIYYAGGSVTRDISSRDIVVEVAQSGIPATYCEHRAEIPPAVADVATPGDVILVMGARDPSLTDFCHEILACLRVRTAESE
jgi:UDP-N-acetylmuramate--alanine ligase